MKTEKPKTTRKIEYRQDSKWAEIELELKEGIFTAHGSFGEIIPRTEAVEQVKEYWRSFFEESPDEIWEMNKRCGCSFGPNDFDEAAEFVLDSDGELHGLDVHYEEGEEVWLMDGGGQCLDRIFEQMPFFPGIGEIVQLWEKYHLNGLHAGCEHQRALGWEKDGYDKHPSQPCPTCGYKFGSSWNKVEIPAADLKRIEQIIKS